MQSSSPKAIYLPSLSSSLILTGRERERDREMKTVFLRFASRRFYDSHQEERHENDGECTSLTVWRKSLLVSCNGFTVIDSGGNLVYRVDNYMGRRDRVVLMDGYGKPLLTLRRHKVMLLIV